MSSAHDLLLELGCEELPASFVEGALSALPALVDQKLAALRLTHAGVEAMGTPRRLAFVVTGVAAHQPDLEEQLTGPPVRAAFKDGAPTKAAEAFAAKVGCPVEALERVDTPKGEYLIGTRREKGRPAAELLPSVLVEVASSIPFRKSMRWASFDFAFGRPIQWVVALLGGRVLDLEIAGVRSGRASRGHRFLAPAPVDIAEPSAYVSALRAAHVDVRPSARLAAMREALVAAAAQAGGVLIEDEFLMKENLTLVEECHVVAGSFDEAFLELPERVILEVAKGHQRYFGLRDASGKLLAKYLAVVNTANDPTTIVRGSDRVMRARLADAQFFYREDVRTPLAERRDKLGGVVFQKRLGSMLQKAERVERLARELGLMLQLPEMTLGRAASGAHLAKCDLVSLMVGEFPELQGEMGAAYARAQGVDPEVAAVVSEHYMPKGAHDSTPPSDAGALVAMADRLDSLVGCFAIGLTPTGAADPYALRRATIGLLRIAFDRGFDLDLADAIAAAYDGYAGTQLDVPRPELVEKVSAFAAERLRGVLADGLPADAVSAALAVASRRPLDAKARAAALAELDAATRAQVGEVFKRATNIATKAPPGDPAPPAAGAHASETAVYEAFTSLRRRLAELTEARDYATALREVASFAPLLAQYFVDVYVMDDDATVRDGRLRLMRAISESCAQIASLELLGAAG